MLLLQCPLAVSGIYASRDVVSVNAGRIFCSEGCKDVWDGLSNLTQESRKEGAIRLDAPYPPGFAVTITEGSDSSADSQTDTILPAATDLLPTFAHDYRDLGIYGIRKLVPAFVYREHPCWHYNQAHTAVLYMGVPSEGFIDLKVGFPYSQILHENLCGFVGVSPDFDSFVLAPA